MFITTICVLFLVNIRRRPLFERGRLQVNGAKWSHYLNHADSYDVGYFCGIVTLSMLPLRQSTSFLRPLKRRQRKNTL